MAQAQTPNTLCQTCAEPQKEDGTAVARDASDVSSNDDRIDWSEFLADVPTGSTRQVSVLTDLLSPMRLITPALELWCERCQRWQRCQSHGTSDFHEMNTDRDWTLEWVCTECKQFVKRYYLRVALTSIAGAERLGRACKLGEWPSFRPRVPNQVVKLLGGDSLLYQKARLAESVGLGVGAFGYYRRVVENQRNRLLERIRAVAVHKGESAFIGTIDAAIRETQFLRSFEMVRDAVPDVLRIKGHNPLTLLHEVLSQGLHNESDDECLRLCHAVRVFLRKLAENLDFALRDDREVDSALSDLLAKQREKTTARPACGG